MIAVLVVRAVKVAAVVILAAVTSVAAGAGCTDDSCELCSCTGDADCGAGFACVRISDDAACTEDDVSDCSCVVAEGEGEGDALDCAGDDVALGPGTGDLVVADAALAANGTAGSDCSDEGGAPFDLTFTIAGEGVVGDGGTTAALFGDEQDGAIAFATSSDAAAFRLDVCNGGAIACENAAGDAVCACGLCIARVPDDLAVQITTVDGRTSAGVCVEL